MKIKQIYQEIVKTGIENDPRGKQAITKTLKEQEAVFKNLKPDQKNYFDKESLANPYADTRIVWADENQEVKNILVGIDIDTSDILLADRLSQKGKQIDLVISHHPTGNAFINFYEVMDLQIDIFHEAGISLSTSENLLMERKRQVERKIIGANYSRTYDAAKLLGVNLLCMHTPCDNMVHTYLRKLFIKTKPENLEQLLSILLKIPEYSEAAKNNCPPRILLGTPKSKVKNIHLEMTGGTEGPIEIYKELSNKGIDTLVSMHLSEEHFKAAQKENLNVVIAGHISSDSLGVNLMLDKVFDNKKVDIVNNSGFRRFSHK